jgi:hypothetical protein
VSLAGVSMSGCAHYRLDAATGEIAARYPDILGELKPLGAERFMQRWRDRTVFRGADLKPLWQLRGRGSEAISVHPVTGDIFVADEGRILRLDGEARTVWVRDLGREMRDERDFLKPCRVAVQAVSPDGKRLLASTWRERMYGNTVAGYEKPTIMLLDAATGDVAWQHVGVMVRESACGFFGDRIAACNSGDSKEAPTPALVLFDAAGQVLKTLPLAAKIASARDLGAGMALIQAPGGAGVGLLDLSTGVRQDFPVSGVIKGVWVAGDSVVVGTWDKALHCFDLKLRLTSSAHLQSQPAFAIARPAGAGLIVGTDSGQILWLDARGAVTRTVDLAPLNIAESDDQWARRWLAEALADLPEKRIEPWVGRPVSTLERAAKYADVSANLLTAAPFTKSEAWTLDAESSKASAEFACQPGATYVLSLFQKATTDNPGDAAVALQVEYGKGAEPFSVLLPVSAGWEERTASFRPPLGATRARLSLALPGDAKQSVRLDRVVLAAARFRTTNVLFQQLHQSAQVDLDRAGVDGGAGATALRGKKPPELKQVIPWTAHLARASGAGEKPPPIVTPWTMLVDGKLDGQESSWTGKPLPHGIFSDHAELTVTFSRPCRLNLVALYQDPAAPARYTRKFALFARTKAGVKLLGSHTSNRSPYTLFTFDAVEASSLIYYWAGSDDGHVRLMEIEAYGAQEDLE